MLFSEYQITTQNYVDFLTESPTWLACKNRVSDSTQSKPKELVLETGPLDTWIIGYFTISTHNLAASSSLQLELPKLKSDEELNFEFLDQEG